MLPIFFTTRGRTIKLALCATALLSSTSSSQEGTHQSASSPPSTTIAYFPPGTVDGFADFFSSYLRALDEPSFLAAAQDPASKLSYRLEKLSSQQGEILLVRLTLNPDGSATIFRVEQSGQPSVVHRAQGRIPATDVKGFLQRVDQADFWSMPTTENSSDGAKGYKLDASVWVLEGVHNGTYHVVFRRGLKSDAFTRMANFLAYHVAGDHPAQP